MVTVTRGGVNHHLIGGSPLGKADHRYYIQIPHAPARHDMSRGGAGLVGYSDSSGEEGGEEKVEEEEEDSEEEKSPPRKKQRRGGKQKQVQKCFLLYINQVMHVITVVFVQSKRVELGSKVTQSFLLGSSLTITMATPHPVLPLPTAIMDMFNEEGNFYSPLTC